MEVPLLPDVEDKVKRMAAENGSSVQQFAADLIGRYVDYDAWFRREVQKGLDQLDRGEFIQHDEVVERIEQLFRA